MIATFYLLSVLLCHGDVCAAYSDGTSFDTQEECARFQEDVANALAPSDNVLIGCLPIEEIEL